MKARYWIVVSIVFLLISLPYLVASLQGGGDISFIGFLVNPIDGNSYLAKMQEGFRGDWLFTLPFTNDPGAGAPIFLFYILLGHVGRVLSLPLIWIFHLARLICSGFLLWTLAQFTRSIFPEHPLRAWHAFVFCVICSGSGWLQLLGGAIPVDLWVAEAYPWMSMYTNPHFPLGMALLLWILMISRDFPSLKRDIYLLIASLGLAIVMPFGVVIGGIVVVCVSVVSLIRDKKLEWRSILAVFVGGGVLVIYQFWLAQSTPQFASWNAQNITSAPGVVDIFISFSPLLLLAGYTIWTQRKDIFTRNYSTLVVWLLVGMGLVFIPFSLQRRFLFALFIPAACLAALGIDILAMKGKKFRKLAFPMMVAFSIPTIFLVLFIEFFGIASHSAEYYLSRDENAALSWIELKSDKGSVVLASPEMGNIIPGQIDRKVIYGHPFETPDAAENKLIVESFYSGQLDSDQMSTILTEENIQYVIWGAREREFGTILNTYPWGHEVFSSGEVVVYEVDKSK